MRRSYKRIGEPLKFGMEDVDKFDGECSKKQSHCEGTSASEKLMLFFDHLRCHELKQRCIAQCNGLSMTYLSEFGGFILLGS